MLLQLIPAPIWVCFLQISLTVYLLSDFKSFLYMWFCFSLFQKQGRQGLHVLLTHSFSKHFFLSSLAWQVKGSWNNLVFYFRFIPLNCTSKLLAELLHEDLNVTIPGVTGFQCAQSLVRAAAEAGGVPADPEVPLPSRARHSWWMCGSPLENLPGSTSSVHPASQWGTDGCTGISGVSLWACCFPPCHWAPLEEPGSLLFAPSALSGYFHVITLPALHEKPQHCSVYCKGKGIIVILARSRASMALFRDAALWEPWAMGSAGFLNRTSFISTNQEN